MNNLPFLPRWTPQDEALLHIQKALIALIYEGEYPMIRELAPLASRLQKSIDRERAEGWKKSYE